MTMLFNFGNHGTGLLDPSRGFSIFTPVPVNTGIIHLENEAKQESNLHYSWTKVLSKAWLLEVSSYRQEFLLMYDLNRQYLYTIQHVEGERPDFTYIDEVIQIEEEPQCRKIFQTCL